MEACAKYAKPATNGGGEIPAHRKMGKGIEGVMSNVKTWHPDRLEKLSLVERQKFFRKAGRLDLLYKNRLGKYTLYELKKGIAKLSALDQIKRYMKASIKKYKITPKDITGVILARSIDPELYKALRGEPRIQAKTYFFSIDLKWVKSATNSPGPNPGTRSSKRVRDSTISIITGIGAAGKKVHSWHVEKVAGANIVYTCPPPYIEGLMFQGAHLEFSNQIWEPAPKDVMNELLRIPYFERGYAEDGYPAQEFNSHPALLATAKEFSGATQQMVDFVAKRVAAFCGWDTPQRR
jgi:hypothetical protein